MTAMADSEYDDAMVTVILHSLSQYVAKKMHKKSSEKQLISPLLYS